MLVHEEPPAQQSRLIKLFRQIIWLIYDQWFLVGMGILILIASQAQVPSGQQDMKDTVILYLCPAIIFLITGCTLPTRTLIANYRRFGLHAFVQGSCFLVDSASVFAVLSLLALNPKFMDAGLMVGLIFMSCSPTTISSNVVMTRSAHGTEAVTVVESTLGNVIAPFITPLLVRMYLASGAWYTKVVPSGSTSLGPLYRRVFKQLGLSMLVPLFAGQVIQNIFPATTKLVMTKYKVSKLGSFSLLLIIWSTYDKAFSTRAFEEVKGTNIIFLVFASMGFYALWLAYSIFATRFWMSKQDTIAVAYCIPAKTPAMGIPLSQAMFVALDPQTSAKLQIPLVIFQGLQIAAGSLATIPFRRWVRGDELAEKQRREEAAREAVAVNGSQ